MWQWAETKPWGTDASQKGWVSSICLPDTIGLVWPFETANRFDPHNDPCLMQRERRKTRKVEIPKEIHRGNPVTTTVESTLCCCWWWFDWFQSIKSFLRKRNRLEEGLEKVSRRSWKRLGVPNSGTPSGTPELHVTAWGSMEGLEKCPEDLENGLEFQAFITSSSLSKALRSQDAEKWKLAIIKEFESMISNQPP